MIDGGGKAKNIEHKDKTSVIKKVGLEAYFFFISCHPSGT